MKVFYLMLEPYINGAGLNFKSNLRPVALVSFIKRENFKNFAAREYCADRINFKIFASDEIKFATRSIAKFTAYSWLKFEPRGAEKKQNEI